MPKGAPALRLNHVTLRCANYEASVAFYTALGLKQIVAAAPRYARFETLSGETLSIDVDDADDATTTAGAVIFFAVEDVDEAYAAITARGIAFERGPKDKPYLWREAALCDPSGNEIRIYRAGENHRFPPWRLEDA